MNTEEIDYWLRLFSNNNQSFMSKDGKKITLFKVFQELKELHYLLKIKNDYIKELEAYKYNMDHDYLRLEKENEEVIEEDKKIEIPEHIPNEVIQDLDRAICPANVKCIAHKVNELINYLQHINKGENNE